LVYVVIISFFEILLSNDRKCGIIKFTKNEGLRLLEEEGK